MPVFLGLAVEHFQEKLSCAPPLFFRILPNCSQCRFYPARFRHIIKTGNRNVVRHLESRFFQLFDRSDRKHIGNCEDCSRLKFSGQESGDRAPTEQGCAMFAFEYSDVMAKVNISLFQGKTITYQSLFFRIIKILFEATPIDEAFAKIFREPAADNAEAFVPELDQVLGQSACPRAVANSDRGAIGASRVVDENCRQPTIFHNLHQGRVDGGTVQNDSVDRCVSNRFRICRRAVWKEQESESAAFQGSSNSLEELLRRRVI